MTEQHTMQVERVLTPTVQMWRCPTCGRRIVLRMPPRYARMVLEPGDESAIHTGGIGGISMTSSATLAAGELTDDDRVWLRDHGIEAER